MDKRLEQIFVARDTEGLKALLSEHAQDINPNEFYGNKTIAHELYLYFSCDDIFATTFFDAAFKIPINLMTKTKKMKACEPMTVIDCLVQGSSASRVKVVLSSKAGIEYIRQHETRKNSAILKAIGDISSRDYYPIMLLKTLLSFTRISIPIGHFSVALNPSAFIVYKDFIDDPCATRKRQKMERLAIQADLMDSALVFCFVMFIDHEWFYVTQRK